MVKAIALHSIIPVRTEPREGAEQATQMLFAQTADLLQKQDRWTEIRIDDDGQAGWVDSKMITPVSKDDLASLAEAGEARVVMPMAYAVSPNSQTVPLTAGTLLPHYKDNGTFNLLGAEFRIDPQMVLPQPLEMNLNNLMQVTRFFLNIPYLWGGKNAMGMDCSGFTQVIMSMFGRHIKRNASEQARQGRNITTLAKAQTGDLVFFNHSDIDSRQTNISHVGILLDSERVIHCSGRVKTEKIDSRGIVSFEPDGKEHYTHCLAEIRRV